MRRIGLIVVVATAILLTGCTSSAEAPASPPTSSADAAETESDRRALDEAQRKVDEWLSSTPVPAGATREEMPTVDAFDQSHQGWVCSPMATGMAYWSVPSMTVLDVAAWMIANPVPGLVPTLDSVGDIDPAVEIYSFGNIEERGIVEGIAFTLAQTGDDVAIRAEAGVIPETSACETLGPDEAWGSPGEG